MARHFLYVYERIYKGISAMEGAFKKLPVRGKRTAAADVKRIRKIVSDETYLIARECGVIVSFPRMRIEGERVVLAPPSIMLPNCRIVSIETLKEIEHGGKSLKS